MKTHQGKMSDLLQAMGSEEHQELAKVLVDAINEQKRQRKLWSKEFDDKNNAYEWAGYLVKTFGKALASFPVNPKQFRKQVISAIALLIGAVLSVDRNPENIIKKI